MFFRALLAFLALPGVVAGLIPALIVRQAAPDARTAAAGFGLLGVGLVLLLWCVRDFYVAGKGTLAPWEPPQRLVIVGLYRFVRNPMYLAVLAIVLGWALAYASRTLLIYAALLAIAFHLRVVLYEEPRLRQQFGAQWSDYASTVPRWLPRPPRKP